MNGIEMKKLIDANSFVDFIFKQDDDRTINHNGGWNKCAVGDYNREVLGGQLNGRALFEHQDALNGQRIAEYIIGCYPIYRNLVMGTVANKLYPTYGQLKKAYEKQGICPSKTGLSSIINKFLSFVKGVLK